MIHLSFFVDSPTSKFGEALRTQVEERLNFFETGAPPSKNTDAIRKVLESLALDEDDEDDEMAETEPILPLIEPTPKKEKKKKRKSDAMDIDGEEDDRSSKKVKLSKEEKKALKQARKEKKEAKELAKAAGCEVGCLCLSKIANPYPIS
jgi:nucleolar protein 56